MWIEGIGNDVVYALGAFLGIFVPILIMIFKSAASRQHIHPASEQNVQETREEVTQQRSANQQARDHQTTGQNTSGYRPMRHNDGNLQCPICLGDAQFAIQTNCGHVFCGLCMTTYWHHGTWLGAVNCPVCRNIVTLLLINFTPEEHTDASTEKAEIVAAINQYNRRFSGQPRPWMDYVRDLPTLLRHAVTEFFSVGGLIAMFRIRVIICFLAALMYFVSPFDILPESAFGLIGFLDDIFVILLLAIYVSLIYRQVVQQRANA